MSIEKNNKNSLVHEDGGFTTTINHTIQNIKHTGALGIYCYLASKPANWDICKEHLQNHFQCGKAHINTCFKYLKKIGAIEIIMNRDSKGRVTGWSTILKRKINPPIVEETQNTENQDSGDLSRIPVFHNLDNPESGKSAIINKRTKTKEREREKTKKETPSVVVFSNPSSVLSHLNMTAKNRGLTLSETIADEIVFYVGNEKDFDQVVKKINIALKLIQEGKWKTPYGFHSKNPCPSKNKPETEEEKQQRLWRLREEERRKTFPDEYNEDGTRKEKYR